MKTHVVALHSFGLYDEFTDNNVKLNAFLKNLLNEESNDLLIRLYKKYIKEEDLAPTLHFLKEKRKFSNSKKLKQLIEKLENGIEGALYFKNKYGTYEPLRFVILDEPYCTLSDNIPLEDYDNNEDEPFWMRPEYIIEKYGKNTYLEVNTMTPTSYEHTATYKDGQQIKR